MEERWRCFDIIEIVSQSLVNEGRFPLNWNFGWKIESMHVLSQSLVNEGRFPPDG